MKNLKTMLLVAVLGTFLVSSCKKDEEDNNTNNAPTAINLVGTWNIDTLKVSEYEDGVADGFDLPNSGTVTLNADKKGSFSISLPGFPAEVAEIMIWERRGTNQVFSVTKDSDNEIDTTIFNILVDKQNSQTWFNADPNSTDPNRSETTLILTRK
jgi:hypothetical protein